MRDSALLLGFCSQDQKAGDSEMENKERTRWREANQTSSQTRLEVWAAPQGVKGGEEQFETSSPPVEPFLTVPTSEMEPSTCVEGRWAWLMGYVFAFWPDWELSFSAPRPSARLTRSLCYGSYGWGRLPLSNGPLSWLWWYNLVEVWKRKSCWCSSMSGRFKWKIVLIRMEQTVWR